MKELKHNHFDDPKNPHPYPERPIPGDPFADDEEDDEE